MKKLIYALGSITTGAAIVSTVASCGSFGYYNLSDNKKYFNPVLSIGTLANFDGQNAPGFSGDNSVLTRDTKTNLGSYILPQDQVDKLTVNINSNALSVLDLAQNLALNKTVFGAFLPSLALKLADHGKDGWTPIMASEDYAPIFDMPDAITGLSKNKAEDVVKSFNDNVANKWGDFSAHSTDNRNARWETQSQNTVEYRSAIYITGSDKIRQSIINAWNNKDWDTFQSYGLAFKNKNSEDGYVIPEAMLKKQFGSSFKSIQDERYKPDSRISVNDRYEMAKEPSIMTNSVDVSNDTTDQGYHISFGSYRDMMETQGNKIGPQKNPIILWNNASSTRLLTVSDPIPNDLLMVRNKSYKPEMSALVRAFKENAFNQNPLSLAVTDYYNHIDYYNLIDNLPQIKRIVSQISKISSELRVSKDYYQSKD